MVTKLAIVCLLCLALTAVFASLPTPAGKTEQSSSYKDGSFLLKLPDPVEGGTYTCRLPPSAARLHDNTTGEATQTVDNMEARLAVLEARQASLENVNNELKTRVHDLENLLLNQTVSFHARLNFNINVPVGSTLILPILLNNHGNAYNGTTGKFTAPYTATYCFLATTEDFINGPRSVMSLVVDGKEVDYVETDGPSYRQSASVHAVLRLTVGQKVWLNVPKDNNYFGAKSTAFSGFLVDHSQ